MEVTRTDRRTDGRTDRQKSLKKYFGYKYRNNFYTELVKSWYFDDTNRPLLLLFGLFEIYLSMLIPAIGTETPFNVEKKRLQS